MKKLTSFCLIIILSIFLFSPPVFADMGPKPTAEITVAGMDVPYTLEILIHKETDINVLTEAELLAQKDKIDHEYYTDFDYDLFNGYQDEDGFVSRSLYTSIPASLTQISTHTFKIGYFSAPEVFKIAIIIDDGILITSKVIHRKMFNATFVYNLDNVDVSVSMTDQGIVTEAIPIIHMTTTFLIRVILTILIELGVLYFFKYVLQKSYLVVLLTNLITQSLLTIFMIIGFYAWGNLFGLIGVFVLGEGLVFLSEYIVYHFYLKEKGKKMAFLYVMAANFVTLVLGILTIGYI